MYFSIQQFKMKSKNKLIKKSFISRKFYTIKTTCAKNFFPTLENQN